MSEEYGHTTVGDIMAWIEGMAGHALNADEGLGCGDKEAVVEGMTRCWMPDPGAITFAHQQGHNLIVHHEALVYEGAFTDAGDDPKDWPANRRRRELLEEYGINAVRVHGTLDELIVFEAFRKMLGLREVAGAEPGNCFRKIYRIEPRTYGELIEQVKRCTGLAQVRCTRGDRQRKVEIVAMPWGGMALMINAAYLKGLMALGSVDVMIAGETDNYAMRFCQESGIEVIETSHEISENEGVKAFGQMWARQYPEIPSAYYENDIVWELG